MTFDLPDLGAIGQAQANTAGTAGASEYRPNVEDVDMATREAIRRIREQIDALQGQAARLETQQNTVAATPAAVPVAPEYETATIRILYVGAFRIRSGYDAPEGRVQGNVGRDLWFQVSTTAASVLWVKTTGVGFTGWQAINATAAAFVDLISAQTVGGAKNFTSPPLVPTAAPGDNSTKAANTAFMTAAQAAKRYAASIGDGVATVIAVTHNLGTRDVQVSVYRNSGAYDEVAATSVDHTDTNTVTLTFGAAPGLNAFRVVVIR